MTFLTDHHLITTLLRQVAEMTVIASGDEAFPIGGMHDITSSLKALKVPGNLIPADELLRVRRTLVVMADISSFFSRHRDENGHSVYQALDEVAFRLSPFSEAVRLIDRVLDQYGNVRDTASPELGDIRRRMASMTGAVQAAIRRVMTRGVTQGVIDSDASPAMRDGRLVVPVAPMYKRKVAGIVHDESASGKTVYIEPAEVVEANNRIRELQMEERREVMRILAEVAATLRPHADEMLESLDVLGEIDFIYAKAGYALDINATLPVVTDGPELEWYHACHPVLLKKLGQQGREIVPLDITLSAERRMLIISGPNAGGKSVCLKTVGIVQYMTQCGLLPPVYENSRMGVFEDIFVDIGDDQSIENDLSTYSSHLRNMKTMTVNGRSTSLVLVDEFGAGTEPQIGGAIAQAILHRFNESGMWGVITTHYQNLKEYADHTPGLVNGSMLYDRQLMQPLFKLAIG
ncbi:MAG: endonuclease MutS2, partial [Paramuribaculum sp.]|nr:endonuclease MutS2 [Paramuribaculum sp.]